MINEKLVGQVFSFVMEEVARHRALGFEALKSLERTEIFCSISSPDFGIMVVGRSAYERLRTLTHQALEASPFHRRVNPDEAFSVVKKGFGETYLVKGFTGSTDAEDLEHIARWIAEAGKACATLSHIIPCQIGMPNGTSFTVGPVVFQSRFEALKSLAPKLSTWAIKQADRGKPLTEKLLSDVREYLDSFHDVAHVTVENCDPKTSIKVAEDVVHAALAYVHVMAGTSYTRKMRGGGPALSKDLRSSISIDSSDDLHLGWSVRWEGAHLSDEFWGWLWEEGQRPMTEAAGSALMDMVERRKLNMLAVRYLDAAAWYADAAREDRPTAAIVKYLTAMERLLWTGRERQITERLAERTAALCFSVESWNFHELKEQVREAYKLRSGIVHGSIGADDPVIVKNYRLCERVSRDLLKIWLYRYGHSFSNPITMENFKSHLDAFVIEVKEEVDKRAAVIAE